MQRIYKDVSELVGNTPLMELTGYERAPWAQGPAGRKTGMP